MSVLPPTNRRLVALMRRHRLTSADMAAIAEASLSAVSKWRCGARRLPKYRLRDIERELGVR